MPDNIERASTVAQLCAELVRFDTSNYGEGRSEGECELALRIAQWLRDAGYQPLLLGPSPDRTSVLLRVQGTDPSLPGLLVHGHLDVVPVDESEWSIPPFGGVIADGFVWGRGCADMKDMLSMMLAILMEWSQDAVRPNRDILFAFLADEEDGGGRGAQWLVREHPELFAGVSGAIGEGGGQPINISAAGKPGLRLYPVATAERGAMHVRLLGSGTAGHGSRPTPDNAVLKVIDAAHRIAHHVWPIHLCESVREYMVRAAEAIGVTADLSNENGILTAIDALGMAGDQPRHTVRGSSSPTVLSAGRTVNVIPAHAVAEFDVRCPPGYWDEMMRELDRLIGPEVEYEFLSLQPPIESVTTSGWFQAITACIEHFDRQAVVVPACTVGGTDAKAFTRLGIECYGFAPLGLDDDGREPGGVHGVDECMPVAALERGKAMLDHFLRTL